MHGKVVADAQSEYRDGADDEQRSLVEFAHFEPPVNSVQTCIYDVKTVVVCRAVDIPAIPFP